MGTSSQNIRRFRINPVEVAIFSIVTLIFFNSLYNLFYDRQGFQTTALAPMLGTPTSEGRTPAATTAPTFTHLNTLCDQNSDHGTSASKVRLTGPICGTVTSEAADANKSKTFSSNSGAVETLKPLKTQIVNQTNQFTATVFMDTASGKFSTDYIPLEIGSNSIQVEFFYPGGKTFTQQLFVHKNGGSASDPFRLPAQQD